MFPNSKFHHNHDLMLNSALAGARGVNGSLHFTVPSMNRLNQTEKKLRNTEYLKKAKHDKNENMAGSVCILCIPIC
jgi:hypothetical protein